MIILQSMHCQLLLLIIQKLVMLGIFVSNKKTRKIILKNKIYNRERKIEIKEVEGQIAVIIEIISHLCYSTFKILYYNDRCWERRCDIGLPLVIWRFCWSTATTFAKRKPRKKAMSMKNKTTTVWFCFCFVIIDVIACFFVLDVDFDDDELLDKTRCAVGTNHRNMHTIEQKLEPVCF